MDNQIRTDDNPYVFSVIMPVYNTSPYLKRCLDSMMEAVRFVTASGSVILNRQP